MGVGWTKRPPGPSAGGTRGQRCTSFCRGQHRRLHRCCPTGVWTLTVSSQSRPCADSSGGHHGMIEVPGPCPPCSAHHFISKCAREAASLRPWLGGSGEAWLPLHPEAGCLRTMKCAGHAGRHHCVTDVTPAWAAGCAWRRPPRRSK